MTSVLALSLCFVVSPNIVPVVTSIALSRSSVVLIGDRVELNCSVTEDDLVVWSFTAWNTSSAINIYFGEEIVTLMRSRYNISKKITGQQNLVVDSVDLAHAGRYRCIDRQRRVFSDVQLTVLDPADEPVGTQSTDSMSTLYGPRNISIFRYEDSLECSADGNPTPIYRWTHMETNIFTEGPLFMLDALFNRQHTLQCTARNMFGSGTKLVTISGSTESEEKTTGLNTAKVALILASLSLAGFVLTGLGLGLTKLSNKSFNAGGELRQSDSLDRATAIPRAHTTDKISQITDGNEDYCAMEKRPSIIQRPELYCELRLNDQPRDDYINQPSAEQKLSSKEATYFEITEPHQP